MYFSLSSSFFLKSAGRAAFSINAMLAAYTLSHTLRNAVSSKPYWSREMSANSVLSRYLLMSAKAPLHSAFPVSMSTVTAKSLLGSRYIVPLMLRPNTTSTYCGLKALLSSLASPSVALRVVHLSLSLQFNITLAFAWAPFILNL